MKTRILAISTVALLTTGVVMHHARYCPLQQMMKSFAHHPAKPAEKTTTLAINKPAAAIGNPAAIGNTVAAIEPSSAAINK